MGNEKHYSAHFLSDADEYIKSLTNVEQGTIAADVRYMQKGEFDLVYTKRLRGAVRELISGRHRVTYFLSGFGLYFVRGFKKQSGKTPKREIDYAIGVLKRFKEGA